MSDNPQRPAGDEPDVPGEPTEPSGPQDPYGQPAPPAPEPYQQASGQESYPQPGYEQPGYEPGYPQPGQGQLPYEPPPGQPYADPAAYPGNEYPPDRSGRMAPVVGADNFFGALFDYSFTRYITPSIVKIVYVVITILVALGWLAGLVTAFSQGWLPGILFLVFGWIFALVYLALARITLEFFIAVINVSEKVNRYAERDGLS